MCIVITDHRQLDPAEVNFLTFKNLHIADAHVHNYINLFIEQKLIMITLVLIIHHYGFCD